MASIKILLNESITLQTRKLGQLKFSTLRFGSILETVQLIEKFPPNREAFLQVLYALQLEPKKDRNSLSSLSDATLIRIGEALLNKSNLIDRYKNLKRGKGNFFLKFICFIRTLADDSKKSQEKFANRIWPLMKCILRDKRHAEHLAADLGKGSNDFANGYLMKESERLMKEAKEVEKWLGSSISMTESLKNLLPVDKRLFDDIHLMIDDSKRFFVEHDKLLKVAEQIDVFPECFTDINFKDTLLGMKPFLMKMPDWQVEATTESGMVAVSAIDEAVRNATGDFTSLMEKSEVIAADIKKLYGGMSSDEINRYQEIWQTSNFPAFIENPLNVFGDYIAKGEKSGYLTEAEIDKAKAIQSFLRHLKEKLPLSKKTKTLCAMIALDFVKALKDIEDRLENGTLAPWAVVVAVLILSTEVLILYYQFMNEKQADNE